MGKSDKKRAKLMVKWKALYKERKRLDSRLWTIAKKMRKIEEEVLWLDKFEREKQKY